MTAADDIVLEVSNLVSAFDHEGSQLKAVDDVSFTLKRGETLGLVGESGCGKSVTALSIMRLLPKPAGEIVSGRIQYQGKDILAMPTGELHHIRGNNISMIFQEPMTALNPVYTVLHQMSEVYQLHRPEMSKSEIRTDCIRILREVGIPSPENRLNEYPHQLSGGMRQRVMIAMALSCSPDILIADEPTTALDVTIQAQILELIRELQEQHQTSVIFITHDLGVVAQICDNVMVMYAGKIVESASAENIFFTPLHPYTRGLIESIPRLGQEPKSRLQTIKGMVPSIDHYPAGCRFQNRCPRAFEKCTQAPPMIMASENHLVSCHLYSSEEVGNAHEE